MARQVRNVCEQLWGYVCRPRHIVFGFVFIVELQELSGFVRKVAVCVYVIMQVSGGGAEYWDRNCPAAILLTIHVSWADSRRIKSEHDRREARDYPP